jgi:RNA polymerase sigma-70 factor (ECF subfamily)
MPVRLASKKFLLECNRASFLSVLRMVEIDRDLFWRLLEGEHPRAESFCRRLAGNLADGDDLYQDSLLKAMRKFDRMRDNDAFKAWLYRIIVNTFVSGKRLPWYKRRVQLTTEIVETLAGNDPNDEYESRRLVHFALGILSPEDRALVTLHEIDGWGVSELAVMLGRPQGTIKSRLARSRIKMRQALAWHLRTKEENYSKEETKYALPQSET